MTTRWSAAAALAALMLSGACKPKPAPRPSASDAGAVAAADAATPQPRDPCAGLEPAQRDLVVAQVGDQRLTLCDFARRVNSQNPYLRARFNAPEQRRALLESWVDTELLAAEAQHRHLDDEPEVRRAVTIQLARRLEQSVREGVNPPQVTDAEVRAYYDAHRADYETDAQVRASQIVLRTREEAERALADVRAHADDDAYFRAQARERSVAPTARTDDGDLAFFPNTGGASVPPEVARAAFTLTRAGEVFPQVVESAHGGPDHGPGFHVIRLTARREPLHRTLEDETRRIRNLLTRQRLDAAQQEAMRALIARLRAASTVQIDEAALANVRVRATPGAPAALQAPPNGGSLPAPPR
ncbi:MAG: peptidylprolyl isomerase [Polyangiales bacterium]